MSTTTVGPPPSTTYTWRIAGVTPALFSGAANGESGKLTSPQFTALGMQWVLMLYPNDAHPAGAGKLAVVLMLAIPDVESLSATVSLSLCARTYNVETTFSTLDPFPAGATDNVGWQVATHAELLATPEVWFPGGLLTLTVTISTQQFSVTNEGAVEAQQSNALPAIAPPTLQADLSSLLTSGKSADVTLLCGSDRISAHSQVLCARSAVLQAQLCGPMACPLNAVPVPDEIEPPILRRTLEFIYTDECEPASAEEAQHLLNAADHFGLPRLRTICERSLASTLSVENAAFTLTLAEQHSADGLRDAAFRFVAKNAVAVMKTEGWAHLKASAPETADAAIVTALTGQPPERGEEGGEAADGSGRRVRRRTQ